MKFLFFLLILIPGVSNAQSFTEHFRDSTLRIDYIFAGDVENQSIYVDELNMSPRWWGKRQRLADVPMEGNGQVIVRDHHSHQILYRNSAPFSRSGSLTMRPRQPVVPSRTFFWCQCPATRSI